MSALSIVESTELWQLSHRYQHADLVAVIVRLEVRRCRSSVVQWGDTGTARRQSARRTMKPSPDFAQWTAPVKALDRVDTYQHENAG